MEHLIVRLLTSNYLEEDIVQNAYAVNTYIKLGGYKADSLASYTRQSAVSGTGTRIEFDFLIPPAKSKKVAKTKSTVPRKRAAGESSKGKGKGKATNEDLEDADDSDTDSSIDIFGESTSGGKIAAANNGVLNSISDFDDGSDSEVYDWSYDMRQAPQPKRMRKSPIENNKYSLQKGGDNEVIELSSD